MHIITKHLKHYLPLFGVLLAGIIGFGIFSYDKSFQAMVTIATAVGYITWGIVHHHIHGDLHYQVVTEYLVIATLGVILILSILFRG